MSHSFRACSRCEARLDAAARYCHRCGHVVESGGLRHRRAWLASGLIVVASTVLAILAARGPAPAPAPDMTGGQAVRGVVAPDISGLTPRERFDRLYGRVMTAAEAGDSAAVIRFTDHALFAYAQLEGVDADARYHFAVLAIQIGRYDQALAVADTILATMPGHLFGYLIQGSVAELTDDTALFQEAKAGFVAAWSTARIDLSPEYQDHMPALDDFRIKTGAPERTWVQP